MGSKNVPSHHASIVKWLATVGSFIVAMTDFALLFTFGAVYVQLLDKYGSSRATTALVQSLFMGTGTSCGLLSGLLVAKFGVAMKRVYWTVGLFDQEKRLLSGLLVAKFGAAMVSFAGAVLVSTGFIVSFFARTIPVLVVSIGILSGIGVSFMFVSSSVVVGKVYKGKSREIALAFQTFCIGVGMVGYPYVLNNLVSAYGVSGTFLFIGGVLTNNFVIAGLFHLSEENTLFVKKAEKHTNEKSDRASEDSNNIPEDKLLGIGVSRTHVEGKIHVILNSIRDQFAHLLSFKYIIVVAATGLVVSSINGVLVVFLDLLSWKGLTPESSLNCFTAVNIGNTLVRLMHVVLLKLRPNTNPAIGLVTSSILGVVGLLLILFIRDEIAIIFGSALVGWTVGGVIAGSTVSVATLVNADHFGVAFGLLLTVFGILGMASGPLYGYIRDSVQSYKLVLVLATSLNGGGAILYALTVCRARFVKTTDIGLEKPQDIP